LTGLVRPSVRLSHMNYVEYLLNLTTQLDHSSVTERLQQFSSTSDQQCFMLFSVCVKRALAITENTLQQNIISSKWRKTFLIPNLY